jgi:2'-5' RNA ligase
MRETSPLPPPLVLTLKLDPIAFDLLDQLRKQYFPPARNFLPAHITLFHALPGDQKSAIQQTLQSVCAHTSIIPLLLPKPRFLGKGTAVEVDAPELVQLQNRLAEIWDGWLTAQDRQRYRPHVTIQNKVAPDTARQLYNQLANTWEPVSGQGEGLLLWHYEGGPWNLASEFTFER